MHSPQWVSYLASPRVGLELTVHLSLPRDEQRDLLFGDAALPLPTVECARAKPECTGGTEQHLSATPTRRAAAAAGGTVGDARLP